MDQIKSTYLKILNDCQVLRFGRFETKSGRQSPYFFNTGNISTGLHIEGVARCFAQVIKDNISGEINCLFGPAYKGIPIAVETARSLSHLTDRNISYCYDRKEEKKHGETGWLVGQELTVKSNLVIVEDVLTAGTSVRASIERLQNTEANILGCVVGIDRQEIGRKQSARIEIERDFGIPVFCVVTLQDIITSLEKSLSQDINEAIRAYTDQYCQL